MGNTSSMLKKLKKEEIDEEKQNVSATDLTFLTDTERDRLGYDASKVTMALIYLNAFKLLSVHTRAACIQGGDYAGEMQYVFKMLDDYSLLNEKNIAAVVAAKEHAHCMGQVLINLHIKRNLSDKTRQHAIGLVNENDFSLSVISNNIPQDDSLPRTIASATGSLAKLSAVASAGATQQAQKIEELNPVDQNKQRMK